MDEDSRGSSGEQHSIAGEFAELGRQLGEAFRAAWQSDERRDLERELREGLQALVDQLENGVRSARGSEALRNLRADVEEAAAGLSERHPARELRQGLLQGLRQINDELGRVIEHWQGAAAEDEPGGMDEGGAS